MLSIQWHPTMGVTQEWIAASHRGASNRNHPSFQLLACRAQCSEPCLQCNSLSRGLLHVWGNCCLVMWAAAAAVKCDDSRRILAAAPRSSLDSSRLFRDHHPGPLAYGGTPGNRQRAEEWGDHYRSLLWLTFWQWWGLIIYTAYFRDTGFTFFHLICSV